DIGKVAIEDAILRKPGPLTAAEFATVKLHAGIGGDILANAAERLPHAKYITMAAAIARHHHERFDGSGYPDNLAGLAIPLAARIVAVADVFDALTSNRVYHRAIHAADAAQVIVEGAGTQFDPAVVEAFRSRFADFKQARSRFNEGC